MPSDHVCHACGASTPADAAACARCGAPFPAPNCERCGQPVAGAVEAADTFHQPAWNTHWNGQCGACGHRYASSTTLRTGHTTTVVLDEGTRTAAAYEAALANSQRSEVDIRAAESIFCHADAWDHQPTVVIEVRRACAGNAGRDETRLAAHETINLTIAECREIMRQLQGPLALLLRRHAWWKDTT